MAEPKFEVGQRVHVKSVTSKRIEGEILDRHHDGETEEIPGEWFYSIDRRNYLHEDMLEPK